MGKLILTVVLFLQMLLAEIQNINIRQVTYAGKVKMEPQANIPHSAENSRQTTTRQNAWKIDGMKQKVEEMSALGNWNLMMIAVLSKIKLNVLMVTY